MEIKLFKWNYRFYFNLIFRLKKVELVTGVNSNVGNDIHFLMWDFDDVSLREVLGSLKQVQQVFNLPAISVLKTKENGYHAYCFKACSFVQARGIIAFTPHVDRHYLAIGSGRGYFTLRFTDVKGRGFKHLLTLPSKVEPDLSYEDVNCFVQYTKAIK